MNEQTKKNILTAVRNFRGFLSDEYIAIDDLLADGGKGEAVYQVRPRNGNEWTDVSETEYKICGGAGYVQRILYTAPQAECAPREAQPGKAFTAVFLNVTRDEAGEIVSHPKWSAGSWSHALNDRDRALLDAERAREERNREHVRLNAEWVVRCGELRKDAIEECAKECDRLAAENEECMRDEDDGRFGVYAKKYRRAAFGIRDLAKKEGA